MIISKRRLLIWLFCVVALILILAKLTGVNHEERTKKQKYDGGGGLYNSKDVAVHLRSGKHQAEYIDKKGVHVVVGRYVGDSLDGSKPNLTLSEINANWFKPEEEAGKNGEPVYLKAGEQLRAKRLFHINKFNIVVSDRIPLNRSVLDVRQPKCRIKLYEVNRLPKASIIIVFHNEAWSTLLRTVHSAINRSPKQVIKEIILVDDCSNRTFLREPLEEHLSQLPVVARLLRTEERVGLIQARLRGARVAQGDVLVFLDAHCETTPGWIEPLLNRIKENRKAIVCPVIDIINDDTFAYTKSFSLHWGAFNWELHFRWFTMSKSVLEEYKKDFTRPYRTPVMAGGLFAIDKDYFYELGSYDSKMDIWGGENLELSFRAWMCGGSVEISPCSHVGHIFRKASPYSFPREGGVGAVLHNNLARVALVWMDDMAKFYFKVNDQAAAAAKNQDITERLELREKLGCKSFQWYLDNVWPEHFFPTKDRQFGVFQHLKTGLCIWKPFKGGTSSQSGGNALMQECRDDLFVNQMMVISPDGFLMADESLCLDSPAAGQESESTVRFQACSEMDRQKWDYDVSAKTVTHRETEKCLTHPEGGTSDVLTLRDCDKSQQQRWVFLARRWND